MTKSDDLILEMAMKRSTDKYQMSEGPDPFSDSFDDPISRHGKSVDRTDEIAYRI